MSIFISNTAYLATAETRNRPIIAWHSIVKLSDLLTYGSADGRPVSNLWSPDTATFWEGVGNGFDWVLITNPSNASVDYVAIVKHNLGSRKIPYGVEVSNDGITYSLWSAYKTPANDSPIVDYFQPTTAAFIRIRFSETVFTLPGSKPIAAHVRAGRVTVLPRKIYVDHAPTGLVKKAESVTQMSESGQYLGTVVTRTTYTDEIRQENNLPDFVRDNIVPFANHANGSRPDDGTAQVTFFFAWRPSSFPHEIIYGWAKGNITPENQRNNGMMRWSCSVDGVA